MRKAIIHLKKKDPTLRRIIEAVGPYKIQFHEPTFATLVRSIVFQQLSGRVARVIYQRLFDAVGGEVTPAGIGKLRRAKLRAMGLSRQTREYILALARRRGGGTWGFESVGM